MNLDVGSKLFTDAPEGPSLSPAPARPATPAPVEGWLERQVCVFNKLGAATTPSTCRPPLWWSWGFGVLPSAPVSCPPSRSHTFSSLSVFKAPCVARPGAGRRSRAPPAPQASLSVSTAKVKPRVSPPSLWQLPPRMCPPHPALRRQS